MDINDMLPGNGSTDTTNLIPDISSSINDLLAPFIWLSVALSIVFIGLYVYSMSRRRRLENALFDIQKNIAEMNARDKARTATAPAPPPPRTQPRIDSGDGAIIAHAQETRNEP